ncbi:MAG: TIGR01777 family oxidoreductase [Actinomycetales bacterium]|nr:TIGR01777 family oxidoreductase [Actinomycetales bacterium]
MSTVIVSGASGLIGTALCASLEADGHTVTRLVRQGKVGPGRVLWNPRAADATGIPAGTLEGVDAVVHLAGAGVGDKRWTDAYKREILESRTLSTQTVAAAVAATENKPPVLISASAIGFYGDTGDTAVDEDSPAGRGFLADVVVQWEGAADAAREAGVRVAHPRTGLVMSKWGGAWQRMLPLFKAGLGGKLGSGQQWWSWISLRDEVRALRFLIDSDLSGPVNLTAPNPATNAAVTAAMGRALKRPALLPAPAFALKAALGEFSVEVLGSARVTPSRLERAGFTWLDPTIEDALRTLLAE